MRRGCAQIEFQMSFMGWETGEEATDGNVFHGKRKRKDHCRVFGAVSGSELPGGAGKVSSDYESFLSGL